MRELKIIIILFFVIATSCAQQKKYLSYTVKKGETLKIIAKRIGVKTKELIRLNPDTGRKPAPETLIIIPNNEYKPPTANDILVKTNDSINTKDSTPVKDTLVNTFVLHKVAKGDTYYSLTRAYNVSEEELKILNH